MFLYPESTDNQFRFFIFTITITHTHPATPQADATLSLSIGGATGAFVGTYVTFGDQNWLRSVVGTEDSAIGLTGMTTAGGSTALGFATFQGLQNISFSRGKSWID